MSANAVYWLAIDGTQSMELSPLTLSTNEKPRILPFVRVDTSFAGISYAESVPPCIAKAGLFH